MVSSPILETQIWKDNMTNNEVSFSKDSKSVLIDQVGRNWYNGTRKWEKILVLFLIRWFRHIVTFEPSISSVQTPSK